MIIDVDSDSRSDNTKDVVKAWKEAAGYSSIAALASGVVTTLIWVVVHFVMQGHKHSSSNPSQYHMLSFQWWMLSLFWLATTATIFFSWINTDVRANQRYNSEARIYVLLCSLYSPIVALIALISFAANEFKFRLYKPIHKSLEKYQFVKATQNQEFGTEIKALYARESELIAMKPSVERDQALLFVRASIATIKEVPEKIKLDEQRITAMRMIEDAKELMLPAEMKFEAHQELMQEYHEPMMKEQLQALADGRNKMIWDRAKQLEQHSHEANAWIKLKEAEKKLDEYRELEYRKRHKNRDYCKETDRYVSDCKCLDQFELKNWLKTLPVKVSGSIV